MVSFEIIGAGGIANKLHLPSCTMPDAVVRRLLRSLGKRLEMLARRFDVPYWSHDHQDVLDDPEIDAVRHVACPIRCTFGIEVLARASTLMQKPLCDTMEDADRFVQAVEGGRTVTLPAPLLRYGVRCAAARR